MFRLYSMSRGISLIDKNKDENEIKKTLGEYINTYDTIHYLVVDDSKGYDETIALIHTFKDYMDYVLPEEELQKAKTKIKHK